MLHKDIDATGSHLYQHVPKRLRLLLGLKLYIVFHQFFNRQDRKSRWKRSIRTHYRPSAQTPSAKPSHFCVHFWKKSGFPHQQSSTELSAPLMNCHDSLGEPSCAGTLESSRTVPSRYYWKSLRTKLLWSWQKPILNCLSWILCQFSWKPGNRTRLEEDF